jgi:Ser/Thr protein kinase RdoA (MazF antagonist)
MPEREESWRPSDDEAVRLVRSLGLVPLPSGDQDRIGTTNRIVRCRDSSGRDLVARVRPRWMTEERIRFEHALAHHLADAVTPVLAPVGTWSADSGLFCDVYPLAAGRHGRPVPAELHEAGRLLERFHACARSFPEERTVPPPLRNQATPAEIATLLSSPGFADPDATPAFVHAVRSHAAALERELSLLDPLPRAIRHGDYHLWNLLFAEDPLRVTALLDLDMAEVGPRIYDLSYAFFFIRHALMASHGAEGARVDRWADVYRAFVEGYARSASPELSRDEIRVVPAQMRCVALQFAVANARLPIDEAARIAILEGEYLQPERWLEAEWPALERILLGR